MTLGRDSALRFAFSARCLGPGKRRACFARTRFDTVFRPLEAGRREQVQRFGM